MKTCPTCQRIPVTYEDKFCWKDGAALVEFPVCGCGRSINPATDAFCPRCGVAVLVTEPLATAR